MNDWVGLMDHLETCWIIGAGTAIDPKRIPAEWQIDPVAASSQLDLLALATQCRQFLLPSVLPDGAREAPAIPALSLPLLPARLRGQFRRAIDGLATDIRNAFLLLMEQRGVMAHPFDWRPDSRDDSDTLPAVYQSWLTWAAAPTSATPVAGDEDDWSLMSASERRVAFRGLRSENPALARERFRQLAASLQAERRLTLLDQFTIGLEAADLDLLRALARDRSEKVRHRAMQLRARLGDREPLDEAGRTELSSWFIVGEVEGAPIIHFAKLKNGTQRNRCQQQIQQVTWQDIADVLGITTRALSSGFAFVRNDLDYTMIECAAQTADDDEIGALVQRLSTFSGMTFNLMLNSLIVRLSAAQRRALAMRLREVADTGFGDLLTVAAGPLPEFSAQRLIASAAWRTLLAAVVHDDESNSSHSGIEMELNALGCLLPRDAAQVALDELAAIGLRGADPRLDLLRLNVELPESPSLEGSSR